MLEKVTKDPQMLADVFVNYDCDLEATNLFERMVSHSHTPFACISSLARKTHEVDSIAKIWLDCC